MLYGKVQYNSIPTNISLILRRSRSFVTFSVTTRVSAWQKPRTWTVWESGETNLRDFGLEIPVMFCFTFSLLFVFAFIARLHGFHFWWRLVGTTLAFLVRCKNFFFAIYQYIKTLMDLTRVLSVQVLNHFELSLITHFFSLSDSVKWGQSFWPKRFFYLYLTQKDNGATCGIFSFIDMWLYQDYKYGNNLVCYKPEISSPMSIFHLLLCAKVQIRFSSNRCLVTIL